MLINRLIKMYGLRHKHIRIEDQQLNLKMNTMKFTFEGKAIVSLLLYDSKFKADIFREQYHQNYNLYKNINYLTKLVNSRL